MVVPEIACSDCGTMFLPKTKKQTYCSKQCSSRQPRARLNRFKVSITCAFCANKFEVRESQLRNRNPTFCSSACRFKNDAGKPRLRQAVRVVVNGKIDCYQCKKWKPTNEFKQDTRRISGFHSYCKSCTSLKIKAKRSVDPDWATAQVKRTKNWQKSNPERSRLHMRASGHKRRALKLNTQTKHICTADIQALYDRQQGRCWWCGSELNGIYDVDHIFALSKGGTHTIGNLCCACDHCNSVKQARTPLDFVGRLF